MAIYRPSVDAANCKICAVSDEANNVCLNYGANMKIGW